MQDSPHQILVGTILGNWPWPAPSRMAKPNNPRLPLAVTPC